MATCASPAYLARLGTPHTLQDLATHELVHYVSTLGTRSAGFEVQEGDATTFLPMGGRVTVNSAEAYLGACLAGLGLIQVPLLGAQDLVEQGLLVPVLAQHPPPPMPVTLLYAHRRHLPQRVRMVMDWLAAEMPQGPWLYPEDQVADLPMRMIAVEITREKLTLRIANSGCYKRMASRQTGIQYRHSRRVIGRRGYRWKLVDVGLQQLNRNTQTRRKV